MAAANDQTVKPTRRRKAKVFMIHAPASNYERGRAVTVLRASALLANHGAHLVGLESGFLRSVLTGDAPYPACVHGVNEIEFRIPASSKRVAPIVVPRNEIERTKPVTPTNPQSISKPVTAAPWRDPGMCNHRGCRCQLVPDELPDGVVRLRRLA